MNTLDHHKFGTMSRRRLIAGLGGVASLAVLQSLLSAGPVFGQQTPVTGGIFNIMIGRDPVNFDMFSNQSSVELHVVAPCYNGLIRFDPSDPGSIIPDLASSWDISDDGKTYTFHLLDGVKFHDGHPFTAADVKATFDFIRNPPDGQTSVRKNIFSAIENVAIDDDLTVRFELSRPIASLLNNLAFGYVVIAPKHILEAKGNMKADVVGTGPFRLKEVVAGTYVELEKNPDYHVPDRPYVDGIRLYVVPDQTTAMAYLRSGQLDYFAGIGTKDAERLEAEFGDKAKVFRAPRPSSSQVLKINMTKAPFDDIRVRQAIGLAMDRQEALKVAAAVGASDAGGLMSPGGQWALPPDDLARIAGFGPDPEENRTEAKRLLSEAGFGDGLKTSILLRRGSDNQEANATFAADQLSRIGVQAELVVLETAMYLERLSKADFEIAADAFESTTDPDVVFSDTFLCGAARNVTGVCLPEMDDLITSQSQALDPVERKGLVNRLEILALEQYAVIPMFHRRNRFAVSQRVQNIFPHPEDDNNRRMQDVWLSA